MKEAKICSRLPILRSRGGWAQLCCFVFRVLLETFGWSWAVWADKKDSCPHQLVVSPEVQIDRAPKAQSREQKSQIRDSCQASIVEGDENVSGPQAGFPCSAVFQYVDHGNSRRIHPVCLMGQHHSKPGPVNDATSP